MFDRDDQGEHECKLCSATIDEDHTYCAVHYQAALDQYHADVQQYDQELAEWNALSEDERLLRNSEHDQKQIRKYAIGLCLILTVSLCVFTEQSARFTCITVLGSTLVMWFTRPLYTLLGRIGRGLKKGLTYMVVLVSLLWVGLLFTQHFPYQNEALIGVGIMCVLFGLWRESVGRHHLNAQPQPPVRPKP